MGHLFYRAYLDDGLPPPVVVELVTVRKLRMAGVTLPSLQEPSEQKR